MKFFLVLALTIAAAAAAAVDPKLAEITAYESDNIGVDGYKYKFATSDGKSVEEYGTLKNVGTENEAMEVRGSFTYTGNDGVVYTVTYVANENGFQPSAPHLPVAPSA